MQKESQATIKVPATLKLNDPLFLPSACFAVMFMNTRILYKGKLLSSSIIPNIKGKLLRAIEVGDYLYISQELFENTHWAKLARSGHKILWVVNRPTGKVVGKVVNGKVTKI